MAPPRNEPTTLLGEAIRKRIGQLGISRRELAKRSGISKQTIHQLEHAQKGFHRNTLELLDAGLRWAPGTALAYHLGNTHEIDGGVEIGERITEYFNAIIRHLATMPIEDVERELIMLEEESFGRTFQSTGEALVAFEGKLDELANQLGQTWGSLNGHVG